MKPPRKKPFIFDGVRVDRRIAHALFAEKKCFLLDPAIDPDYPGVFSLSTSSPICSLHEYVWATTHGEVPQGFVIHHVDHNPLNAQLSNLELITRAEHLKRHRAERQRFSPRKREDLGGLYRPHAPRPVRILGFVEQARLLRQKKIALPRTQARPPTLRDQVREAERKLLLALPHLQAEIDHRDSGTPIPKVNTHRKGSDIMLGLGARSERRGCTPAEAALVRVLVKHELAESRDEAASAELDVPVMVLKKIRSRPQVDLALDRWRKFRRLPPPGPKVKIEA